MKAWIAVVMALVGAMGCGQAMAQTGDGNEFLVQCQNTIRGMDSGYYGDPLGVGTCFATVGTVVSMIAFYNSSVASNIRVCVPGNVNNGQAARIVVKFLQGRPDLLNLDRSVLTWMALSASYPCK
ncbi:Rap1a/Tai family immunity protein [Pseudomonas gingeri]|uniref:Rap1a/Tai family immunity protein n=1 Tax=Pseudomonas gingeri TaxID=117681 RepID=UPI0035284A1B